MVKDRRDLSEQFQETGFEWPTPTNPGLTQDGQSWVGRTTAADARDTADRTDGCERPVPVASASAEDDLRGRIRVTADPMIEVAVRVYAEFADRVTVSDALAILARCREDLDAASAYALPELVERLARQRLATQPERSP